MHRIIVFCTLFFLAVSTNGWAGENGAQPIKLGGELRLRSETLIHFHSFAPTARTNVTKDSFVLLRARLYLEANPLSPIRIFLQPQFSRSFAQDESTVANSAAVDDLDLHQGYMDLQKISDGPLSLRLGRQELAYGTERLIGAFGWSNVGRNFDAGKFRLEWKKFWLDGFFAWIQRTAGNQYFGGLYNHVDWTKALQHENYFLLLRDNDGGTAGGAMTVYTIGQHLNGVIGTAWGYDVEGTLQLGKSAGNQILAYAAHADGSYTFDVLWKPKVALEYNFASGDSTPTTGKVTTFQNLFPTNHDKYGYMDLVGWRNIHNPRFSVQISPVTRLSIRMDQHLFLLAEPADGLYAASGVRIRNGTANASRYVGMEMDAFVQYKWNPSFQLLGGYSFFKAGAFLADTGTRKNAHFAYVQTQVTF